MLSGGIMLKTNENTFSRLLTEHEGALLEDWIQAQLQADTLRNDLIKEAELREESRVFLAALRKASRDGDLDDVDGAQWSEVRDVLSEISRDRALRGFSPSATATFVFSLKQALFGRMREALQHDSTTLAELIWRSTRLLDRLGLHTTEVYQKNREEV